jgi:hypothetical protein
MINGDKKTRQAEFPREAVIRPKKRQTIRIKANIAAPFNKPLSYIMAESGQFA